MIDSISKFFVSKAAPVSEPVIPQTIRRASPAKSETSLRKQTFSKVFRWRLPDGQAQPPNLVEVAGSFNRWQRIPLTRENAQDGWHATVHEIQSNRTHHYMLFVDGRPTIDQHCDGLAIPRGPEEAQFQVATDKGPRVMMLFAQTK